jgi:hypothetical protein
MSLLELFCAVDDFCQAFYPQWEQHQLAEGERQRLRRGQLIPSEIMTILIHFHQSQYRNFKAYYTQHVSVHLCSEFPKLISYCRFVQLIPQVVLPLCVYLYKRCMPTRGIAFIDSTPLAVCHNRRIKRHKTFAETAARGKTSMGWFYGFKLHLVINDQGALVSWVLTPGNVDDRKPVPKLARGLWGKLFGDRGYLSAPLATQLMQQGLQLLTHVRRNMTARVLNATDRFLLRKRAIMETVADQLKNISQIEHSRHRSPINFVANVVGGLIAYTFQAKKPSLNIEMQLLSSEVSL